MSESIGQRLKFLRQSKKLKQKEMADLIGISPNYLSELEAGKKKPSRLLLTLLETRLAINPEWLLTGEGPMFRSQLNEEINLIPVVDWRVPEGFSGRLDELEKVGSIAVPEVSEKAFALKVRDDSMAPLIREGNYAVFLPAKDDEVKGGDVVVAVDEWGELIVRRLRRKEAETYLVGDNPEYPSLKAGEKYTVLGRVVKKVSVRHV